ncbi:MAG: DNA repair protein RecN [Pyrinomonadaceae bacterium]
MLKSLNIANFAVIDRLRVEFHAGLNLLTGETGSGKSIIVDAVGLLLGGRSSASQIRTGERLAIVEGLFRLTGEAELNADEVLDEAGIEKERSEEILIRREINASGKSRIFVNDQMTTAGALRRLQPFLVEIHGQGEQRALLTSSSHLKLLDSFAGCLSLRREVGEAFGVWREACKELAAVERELAERERTEDLLQYQLTEIRAIAPQAGEDEELRAEKRLLTHAEKILQLGTGAYSELYESDESVLSRLASIRRRLEELSEIDRRVGPAIQALETGIMSLSDVADQLRGYGVEIEFSPARLAQIEGRMAELEKLKRKYNTDLQGLLNVQHELAGRLSRLTDLSAQEALRRESLAAARAVYIEKAERLTACRRKAVEGLTRRVMDDLRHVAMEEARFIVSLETAKPGSNRAPQEELDGRAQEAEEKEPWQEQEAEAFFAPTGADRVEFLLSANPGESPRPLARVASGGELSRLMLTLRTVGMTEESDAQPSGTIIFDEIDVGIGGRVAEAVGRRLKALSARRQVLCVTHQPQIARFASHHYVVDKAVEQGRTITTVKNLDREERVGELARMIGGTEDAASTREAARWMLDNAEEAGDLRAKRAKRAPKTARTHPAKK